MLIVNSIIFFIEMIGSFGFTQLRGKGFDCFSPHQQSPFLLFLFLLLRAVFMWSETTVVMKQHCTFNNSHLDRFILLAVHKWLSSVTSGQRVLRAVWSHIIPYGAKKSLQLQASTTLQGLVQSHPCHQSIHREEVEPRPSILLVHNFGITGQPEKGLFVQWWHLLKIRLGEILFRPIRGVSTIQSKEEVFDDLKKETIILSREFGQVIRSILKCALRSQLAMHFTDMMFGRAKLGMMPVHLNQKFKF